MPTALIPMNDAPLRREGFARAERLLGEIDRFESAVAAYKVRDEPLYRQWVDSHFAPEQAEVRRLKGEYRELLRLHNWIVAESHLEHLSMYDAYRRVTDEAEDYARGGREVRAEIERARARRERYIEEEGRREEPRPEPPKRDRRDQEIFERISQTDVEIFREACEDEEVAFELLSLSLRLPALARTT